MREIPSARELGTIEGQYQGQIICFKDEITETKAATPKNCPGEDDFCRSGTMHDRTATIEKKLREEVK